MTMLVSTNFSTYPVSPLQFWNPHRESGLGAQEREKKGLGLYTAVPHSEIHNSMHSFEGNRHQFHPLEGERGGMMDVSRSSGQLLNKTYTWLIVLIQYRAHF